MKRKCVSVLLAALLTLALTACGQTAARPETEISRPTPTETAKPSATAAPAAAKTLVAYFSRAGENYGVGVVEKGNTQIVAETIAEKLGADTFCIQTVDPYPESYDECTAVAKQEHDRNARPKLSSAVADLDKYDVIWLGYPIWYGDMPMAVYTFLEGCDFTGKTVVPFCTHAGSGLSGTVGSIRAACRGATVLDGLAITGTTAQNDPAETAKQVDRFLKDLPQP